MKPSVMVDMVEALRREIAGDEAQLGRKRAVLESLEQLYGAPAPRIVRRPGKGADRTGRATVRRGQAEAAKALRTKSGRRAAVAPGSLTDRILETLTKFEAPMKKSAVIVAVTAPDSAVTAELKRLRDDGRIVSMGRSRGARWSMKQFANVLVAGDAD